MLNSTTAYPSHTFANTVYAAVHCITTSAHALVAYAGTFVKSPQEYDEAYLAQAVDNYDLEYRMRELDRGHASQLQCLTGFSH
jgi:hypothetical protein